MRDDWIKIELEEVCDKAEKVKRKKMPLSNSLIYLDISGVDNKINQIVDHKNYTWEDAPSRAQQIVKYGDVLFSTVRTYLRNIALVSRKKYENQICSSGFAVIRGKKSILTSKFVFYFSIYDGFLQPLNQLQTGSSYPAVRNIDVFKQNILLPPLPEQRAIVAKIDQLFSDMDNGIANLKAAKAKLEIYRQAVLKKAFEGELTKLWREKQTSLPTSDELLEQIKDQRLKYYQKQLQKWEQAVVEWKKNGEDGKKPNKPQKGKQISRTSVEKIIELQHIPDTWRFIHPEEIASFDKYSIGIGPFGSNLKVMDYKSSGIPIIFVKNITRNDFSLEQKFVTEKKYTGLIAHSVQPLDILITKMGNPPGDCAIYPANAQIGVITSDCLKFRVFEKYGERRFFKYCIESVFIKKQLGLITQGVAQKKISAERFKTLWFPFCSLKEQTQTVQEIETRLSVCDKLSESIDQSLKKSEALRQSILKKAFEGKLLNKAELQACRQEPDWEPAQKLLASIQKKETKKPSRKRKS